MKICNLLLLFFVLRASGHVHSRLGAQSLCNGLPAGTFLSNSKSRSSYFVCVMGDAIELNCPSGFYFDEKASMCVLGDYQRAVTCACTPPTTPCTPVCTPSTPTCTPSTPSTPTCTPSTPTCTPSTPTCTPSTPTCKPSTPTCTPSTPTCTPSTPKCNTPKPECPCPNTKNEVGGIKRNRLTDCKGRSTGTIFLDKTRCGRYYECNDVGVLASRLCPNGEWFDRELVKCRASQYVKNCVARRQRY